MATVEIDKLAFDMLEMELHDLRGNLSGISAALRNIVSGRQTPQEVQEWWEKLRTNQDSRSMRKLKALRDMYKGATEDEKSKWVGLMVQSELQSAQQNSAPMNSAHEAFGVIYEELDEFWEEVRKKSSERSLDRMVKELIQVAAMAQRAILDLSKKYGQTND